MKKQMITEKINSDKADVSGLVLKGAAVDLWIIVDEFGNRFYGKVDIEYDFETKQLAEMFIDKYCDVINFPENYKIEKR